jgi:hypothetical protein
MKARSTVKTRKTRSSLPKVVSGNAVVSNDQQNSVLQVRVPDVQVEASIATTIEAAESNLLPAKESSQGTKDVHAEITSKNLVDLSSNFGKGMYKERAGSALDYFNPEEVIKLRKEAESYSDYLHNRVDPLKGEEEAIFCIFQNAATNHNETTMPGVLTKEHITISSVVNSKYNRDWINRVYYMEKKRVEMVKKDPKKGIRTVDEEWCHLIDKSLWDQILMDAKLSSVPYDDRYVTHFVIKQIIDRIHKKSIGNKGVALINYDRVKHLAALWNAEEPVHESFLAIVTGLKNEIDAANQRVSDEVELQLLFSLIPEKFARYLLQMLLDIPLRNYGLGSGDSPMDRLKTDEIKFRAIVHDSLDLKILLYAQLKSYGSDMKFNPECLFIMTGVERFPNKDLYDLLKHLIPLPGSVGAIKIKPDDEGIRVRKTGVREFTPFKKRNRENRDSNISSNEQRSGGSNFKRRSDNFRNDFKNETFRRDGTTKTCFNCDKPGHNINRCEYSCTRPECIVKPGVKGHAGKDCTIYEKRKAAESADDNKVFIKQNKF